MGVCAWARVPAVVLATVVGLATAIPVRTAAAASAPAATSAVPGSQRRPVPVEGPRHAGCPRLRATCCLPKTAPCVRPGPARALLLSLGVLAGAASAAILFALGDRLSHGDPGTIMVGAGALAGIGSILGIIAGRTFGDGPALRDRVRRETLGLEYRSAGTRVIDEARPGSMALRFAPLFPLPNHGGAIRIIGEVGGWLGKAKETDPRPQLGGDRPVVLEQNRFALNLGVDFIVALPYPVLRRGSAHLGAAELRFKPDFQYRREWLRAGDGELRIVERTMLLPLTVGVRWHIGPRQRFTFYLGPRFDIVSYSDPGGRKLARGKPVIAPLYAEAWYDIDFALSAHPRRDGRARRAETNGQLSIGYVHSRFDGRGFNFGPVIGFLGPIHASWAVRTRPRGSKAAFQAAIGTTIGNGVTFSANVGVVLPDIRRRP